jgi:hypothetical protein
MEKLTNAGARYTDGGFDDRLDEPGFGTALDDSVRYVDGVTAVARTGCPEHVHAAAVALAQRTEQVTGRPTTFLNAFTGRAGSVTWLTGYDSATAMEQARRKIAGDPGWLALLDATRDCFAVGPGLDRTISRRLG